MAPERAPHVDAALVEWLSAKFPDRCPSEADSSRQVWIAVGAQKVIKHLRKLVETQSENVLHE